MKGERVVQDLNIQKEAGGSNRALVKTFYAEVTNTVMDINLLWAGKGTCCIPVQSTYGPLISAIHVSRGSFSLEKLSANQFAFLCWVWMNRTII